MRTTLLTTSLLALLPSTLSQFTTAPTPAASGTPSIPSSTTPTSADVDAVVSFLLPTLGSTSLSPSQSTAILSLASSYLTSYTQASPLSSLQQQIIGNLIFASTTPNAEERQELETLLQAAPTALVQDPEGFSQSVEALISPFAFADRVRSYESGFSAGLATVVAGELGVSAPAMMVSTTGEGRAPRETGVGAMGVVAGVAVGVVGLVL